MERSKEVRTIGVWVVILALILRLFTLAPLENEAFLSFLVYLQTGRLVRYSDSPATTVPPTTAPKPSLPVPQPSKGLQFTAADANNVEFYDFTAIGPDLNALLLQPLDWTLTGEDPTVLILHTHATESYTRQEGEIYEESSAYRTFNASYNMLSIGEELTRVLESGGISVLHDRTLHDYPSYSGSYDHARKTIKAYLEAFPSIRMVIDLHRDALDLGADTQLTTSATVGTEKSAQLMLIAGSDRNASHPNWQENLGLSVKLTAILEKMYPGITRPLQLRQQRFNLDMTTGSILVEVGANGDSHTAAIVAVRALGAGILALAHGANL
ncbi:MAG: hypothetical protein E7447_00045 [Ruminococcaceae bacterium]|nr:hypothetical protein [Oscillospiraceae bacterium]